MSQWDKIVERGRAEDRAKAIEAAWIVVFFATLIIANMVIAL